MRKGHLQIRWSGENEWWRKREQRTHFNTSVKMWWTVCGHRMVHKKWKETKQLPSILPGPAVPGCYLVSFHILWAMMSTSTVFSSKKVHWLLPIVTKRTSHQICQYSKKNKSFLFSSKMSFSSFTLQSRDCFGRSARMSPLGKSVWGSALGPLQ